MLQNGQRLQGWGVSEPGLGKDVPAPGINCASMLTPGSLTKRRPPCRSASKDKLATQTSVQQPLPAQVLALDPGNSDALYLRGNAHQKLHEDGQAQSDQNSLLASVIDSPHAGQVEPVFLLVTVRGVTACH